MMGRKPAYCTYELDGIRTTSGLVSDYKSDIINNCTKDQRLSTGNRIGHCPSSPKSFISPQGHSRPPSISDIVKDFSTSYFEASLCKNLYYHFNQDGKVTRKMRSEFREMVSMGCSILTHYYDVMTGEVGFRNETGKMVRYSYKQLAAKLGVSLIRVKRFFKFLKERGFITLIEDKGKDDKGNWKSNVSIKRLNPAFFINTLGVGAWKKISRYRDWLMKKVKPASKKQTGNVLMIKSLISTMVNNANIRKSKPGVDSSYKEKLLVEKAMILYETDPSRSLSEYLKKLKQPKS
jgi:hypothetical protein